MFNKSGIVHVIYLWFFSLLSTISARYSLITLDCVRELFFVNKQQGLKLNSKLSFVCKEIIFHYYRDRKCNYNLLIIYIYTVTYYNLWIFLWKCNKSKKHIQKLNCFEADIRYYTLLFWKQSQLLFIKRTIYFFNINQSFLLFYT